MDGIKFIERIGKHLPKKVFKEKKSITESFHKLLQKLNQCEYENSHIKVKKKPKDTEIKSDYEYISLQEDATFREDPTKVKDDPISKDTEIKSDYEYISFQGDAVFREDPTIVKDNPVTIDTKVKLDNDAPLQENNVFGANPTNAQDNPYTQVDVLVNNEVKGMYYCLIENGALLLNKSLEKVQAEYDIPLEKYTFRLEDKIKIEFDFNQLVIKLIFSCENECDNWFEYFFKAKHSIYSYASFPHANFLPEREQSHDKLVTYGSPQLPPRKLHLLDLYPGVSPILARRKSSKSYHRNSDFVDLSTFNLEESAQSFKKNLKSVTSTTDVNDTKLRPKLHKQAKSTPGRPVPLARHVFYDEAFEKN